MLTLRKRKSLGRYFGIQYSKSTGAYGSVSCELCIGILEAFKSLYEIDSEVCIWIEVNAEY